MPLSEQMMVKFMHGSLARYVKSWVAHATGMPGTFSPPPRVSDPDMHYGTCVTHVPWCMPGSLISVFCFEVSGGENVPGFPGACAPAILRIWQEAHACILRTRPRWVILKCGVRILHQQTSSRRNVSSNVFFRHHGHNNLTDAIK